MHFIQVVPDAAYAREQAKAPRRVWHRARPLPATGMPGPGGRQRTGSIISLIVHALLLMLLLRAPALNTDPNLVEEQLGGGGPGPAGGGGGGTGGTGGIKFIKLTPPPPPVVPPPREVPPVLPVIEPPKPAIVEPVLPLMELPKPAEAKLDVKIESPIIGTGGGTGHDGTAGNGPGTGGGVGSGVGTGRGSGVGPGTGGGPLSIYPPVMVEMFIPPLPTPPKVRGFKLIADFYINERGKIDSLRFTGTRDGDYNKKLQQSLNSFRFRPGTTLEGVPIRAKFQLVYEF